MKSWEKCINVKAHKGGLFGQIWKDDNTHKITETGKK